MRNLEHDARTIACAAVGTFGTTVTHVFQHFQCIVYQFMALVTMNVHYHTHAASVVLVGGVIQASEGCLLGR